MPVAFSGNAGSLLPKKVVRVDDAFADTIVVENESFLDEALQKQGALTFGRNGVFMTEGGPPPFSLAHLDSLVSREAAHIAENFDTQKLTGASLDPVTSPKVTALVVEGAEGRLVVVTVRHSLNHGRGPGGTGWLASVASTKWGLRTKLPKGSQIIVQTRAM